MPRYLLSNYALGEPGLLLMSDVSGTSFDGRFLPGESVASEGCTQAGDHVLTCA